jgi:HSP20 family protein
MSDLDFRAVRELLELRTRLRELMEQALLPGSPSLPAAGATVDFPVDVWESDSEVVVEAELPGVEATRLEVRLEGGVLVLSGELSGDPEGCSECLRIERQRGRFQRAVTLPVEVAGTPAAKLNAGVLEVRLPKVAAGRRRVEVKGEAP